MDAREFFQQIVKPNHDEFTRCPSDLRVLWNAVVSANTVPEYVALDRAGYREISKGELAEKANDIRAQSTALLDLKYCAETFKHVRKIRDRAGGNHSTIATSTGVSASDKSTWEIKSHNLVTVLDRAIEELKKFPELMCAADTSKQPRC